MILYAKYLSMSVFFVCLVTGSIPFQVAQPEYIWDAALSGNSHC